MSYRKEKNKSLVGLNYSDYSSEKLKNLCTTVLDNGMHGLCFSPYEEGQKPGDIITESQIRRRLEIIAPYTKWIRSFSCTEGNDSIPKLAKGYGLKTLVGAWLGDNKTVNDKEMKALIELSKAGFVDIAAVGNEVMYRGDLSEAELLEYIQQFKTAVPDVEVG